eukprot:337641-Pleurochrysis_carterae.AAC.5
MPLRAPMRQGLHGRVQTSDIHNESVCDRVCISARQCFTPHGLSETARTRYFRGARLGGRRSVATSFAAEGADAVRDAAATRERSA